MQEALETFTTFTPLGIRAWDPVLDQQVRDGLHIWAHPVETPEEMRSAYRSWGDIYSFSHLPGLRALEYGLPEANASPATGRDFVVQIEDRLGRYVPVAFRVSLPLPYRGVFLSEGPASPAHSVPRGVLLYSSASRRVPNWMAVVRAELVDRDTGSPAAHAVLRVIATDGDSTYGVANWAGRCTLMLPYPPLADGFSGSPGTPGNLPLSERGWDLDLEVLYEPQSLTALPGSELPDYLSMLRQRPGDIWIRDAAGEQRPLLPLYLRYRQSLVAATEGLSQLLVSAATT